MVKILDDNKIYINSGNGKTINKIPVGNWFVRYADKFGFYLEKSKVFEIPSKVYGDPFNDVNRYLESYRRNDKNMGVGLVGLKGSGKTLTARLLAKLCNLPVIIIDTIYGDGADMINFVNHIEEELCIFIDEFEKLCNGDVQTKLLPVMDGITSNKRLFIITMNDIYRVNDYFKNRPGRVRYLKYYESMSMELIEEVVDDLLEVKERRNEIITLTSFVGEMTLDILVSIIRECNMFPHLTVGELVQDMNIDKSRNSYDCTIFNANGERVDFDYDIQVPDMLSFSKNAFSVNEKYKDEDGDDLWKEVSYDTDSIKISYKGSDVWLRTNDGKYTAKYVLRKSTYSKNRYNANAYASYEF